MFYDDIEFRTEGYSDCLHEFPLGRFAELVAVCNSYGVCCWVDSHSIDSNMRGDVFIASSGEGCTDAVMGVMCWLQNTLDWFSFAANVA